MTFLSKLFPKIFGSTVSKAKFEIMQGDITQLGFDVVVNAANKELVRGGGVCGAIYKAAGPHLSTETDKLNPIHTGQAVMTHGYNLCEAIVHAVGPVYDMTEDAEYQQTLLRNAYENALDIADYQGYKTIAFPLISTGIYGYPKKEAIKTAVDTIKDYIANNTDTHFEQIAIVCFSNEDYFLTTKYKDEAKQEC